MDDMPSFASAFAFHPVEYIPPKQEIASFCFPFSAELPYEEINASAKEAEEFDEEELLKEVSESSRAIQFKKPAIRCKKGGDIVVHDTLPEFERKLLAATDPVTKADYVKPSLKVKRVRLGGEVEQEEVEDMAESVVRKREGDFEESAAKRTHSSLIDSTLSASELTDEAERRVNQMHFEPEMWKELRSSISRLWHEGEMKRISVERLMAIEEEAYNSMNTDSAAVMLMILTAGSEDKRVYRQSYVESIVTMLQDNRSPPLTLLSLLQQFILETTVNDSIIVRMEYICFGILFENTEGVVSKGLSLLLAMCKKYPNQIPFVVSEMFANIDKLTATYRTSRGITVNMLTILLIRLVQGFDCAQYTFDPTFWQMTGSGVSSRKSQRKVVKQMIDEFHEHTASRCKGADGVANEVASVMAGRMAFSFTPKVRKSYEDLVSDLLALLGYPEYAGSEPILTAIMKMLLVACQNNLEEKYSASIQSFAFTIGGTIGRRILAMKKEQTTLEGYTDYINILAYLRENRFTDSFQYLYMRCVNEVMNIDSGEEIPNPSVLLPLVRCLDGNFSVLRQSENALTSYHQLLLQSQLVLQYQPFIDLITQNLASHRIKEQAVAIKNLSLLVQNDPSLMSHKGIKRMLTLRLYESRASVCDSILELVYGFLEQHPDQIPEFYTLVAMKVADGSVSVRRKAIGMCTFLYSCPKVAVRAAVSRQLLKRLDDEEDSITFQACETLLKVWFQADDPLTTIRVIIKTTSFEYFERFLKEKVLLPNDLNEELGPALRDSISQMVECVLEFATENMSTTSAEVGEMMQFLAVIVKCDSSFILQDQLLALQPYLTDETATANSLCYHTLLIFHLALPQMTNLNRQFIKECQESILERLTKFNSRELTEAVACLWTLCQRSRTTHIFARAAVSTLALLRKSPNPRLLYMIGCFGCWNLDKHRDMFTKLGLKTEESVTSFLVRHILLFVKSDKQPVKKAAVKSLVDLCVTHPKLFISDRILTILDSAMVEDSSLQGVCIEGITAFLEHEETVSAERNGLGAKMSSAKFDISAFHGDSVQSVNDSICASLVQRYLGQVLKGCLLADPNEAIKAIRFVRLVVSLGFSNPKLCFPTVVALETSANQHIRHIALEMHKSLHQRYESLIESSYSRALKEAVKYRFKQPDPLKSCTFLLNFLAIIERGGTPRKRAKFIKTVANTFKLVRVDKLLSGNSSACKLAFNYASYLAVNFSHIVLNTQEEVLLVIAAANRVVSSEVPELGPDDKLNKALPIAKALVVLERLERNLCECYNVSENLLIKYQESAGGDSKEFRKKVKKLKDEEIELGDLEGKTQADLESLLEILDE